MNIKPSIIECKFTDKDNSKIQNLVSNVFSELEDKKESFIKKLIKEKLSALKITFDNEINFLDFVGKHLSISYDGKTTIIFYRNSPLLTYWYDIGEQDLNKPNFTVTYNFYYL